ncbi:MAG: hypothetical protein PHQ43_07225, partial [Dehalococcoidales bacterium]|nr:hypothetical protein [Dehalococcoidales bacterium]
MFDKNPTAIAGSLRRVWRNAGAPVNGTTLAGSAEKGDLLIDSTNAALYQNTNTQASPTWTQIATGSGAALDTEVGNMAASGTSTANALGSASTAAPIDHVHKLGTHDHSDDTKGGATLGAVTISSITLSGDIDMSGQGTGTYDILLKDAVADALSIKRGSTDVIVFDTTTPKVTITPATTVTGTLTASTGITVSANGITVTGDSLITGALEVTGALTVGGAWTIGATLTVDELILDTDGVAPANTHCYAVRDNDGDLTLNAISGKEIHLAIAGVDVLDVGTSVEVISGGLTVTAGGLTVSADGATITGTTGITGNVTITGDLAVTGAFSFGGALTINDTVTVDELILDTDGTAPAGTNAYLVSDNT